MYKRSNISNHKDNSQMYGLFGIPSFDQWRNKRQQPSTIRQKSKPKEFIESQQQFKRNKNSVQHNQRDSSTPPTLKEIKVVQSQLDPHFPITNVIITTKEESNKSLKIQTRNHFDSPQASKISKLSESKTDRIQQNPSQLPQNENYNRKQNHDQIKEKQFKFSLKKNQSIHSKIQELQDEALNEMQVSQAVLKTSQQKKYQNEQHSFEKVSYQRSSQHNRFSPTFAAEQFPSRKRPSTIIQQRISPRNRISDDIKTQIRQASPNSKVSPIKKKDCFIDEAFPYGENSLWGQYGKQNNWNNIQWKSITDVIQISDIFLGLIDPTKLMPGLLEDCYFFSVISALSQKQNRIKKIFVTKQLVPSKKIVVKLFHKGIEKNIQIDEYVPCIGGRPAFTRSQDNQLWPIFLQKAWAKLFSNYKRIETGYPQQALHDLTGAPIKRFCFKSPSFSKQALWQYLILASRNDYPIIGSTKPGSDKNKSQSDTLFGHLFTVLSATYLKFKGQSLKVIKLRNPWIKTGIIPKGSWQKNDPNWQSVNQKQKQRIGFYRQRQDGIFLMKFDDFVNQFVSLNVAQITESGQYTYLTKKDLQSKGVFFSLQIFEKGNYNLQLHKTPQKSYSNNSAVIRKLTRKNAQFLYPAAKLQIGAYHKGTLYKQYPVFSSSRQRSLFVNYDLKPGRYVVQAQIKFDNSVEQQFDITLGVYSFYKCKIGFATFEQAVDISGNSDIDWTN